MNWGAIGSIIGIIGLAFGVGVWVNSSDGAINDLKKKAEELESKSTIPSGAVMAFYLDKCPPGWSNYQEASGRTIIGVGEGTNLTNRRLGDVGGEENHLLTTPEMPRHSHEYQHETDVFGDCGRAGCNSHATFPTYNTSETGGSTPHNNMPPYLALLYCKKTN